MVITDQPTRRPRMSPRKKRWLSIGSVVSALVGLFALSGVVVFWLYSSTPSYWEENEAFLKQTPVERLEQMAERLQNRLPGQLSEIRRRGEETRTLQIGYQEVNAWLERRLQNVLDNQGVVLPPELKRVMLSADEGDVVLAFRVAADDVDQIVTLRASVVIASSGAARLENVRVLAGNLPLPQDWLTQQVVANAEQAKDPGPYLKVGRILRGETFDPVLPIDPTRQVRLVDLSTQRDGYAVTIETQRRKDRDD